MFLDPLAVSSGVPVRFLPRFGSANIPRQVNAIVKNGAKQAYSGTRLSPKEWAVVQAHNRRFLNHLLKLQKQYPKVFHRFSAPQLGRVLGRFAQNLKKTPSHSLIMSIMGATASGKTTIATKLHTELQKGDGLFNVTTPVISQDNFFKDDSKLRNALRKQFGKAQGDARFFEQKNLDTPDALEKETLTNVFKQVRAGKAVGMPTHSFEDSSSQSNKIRVQPGWTTFVEGLFPLKLIPRHYIDLTIFVRMRDALRKDRWINRNTTERGITHPDALKAHWLKTETGRSNHITPFKKEAMIVLDNSGPRSEMNHAITALARGFRKHLIPIRRIFGK